MGVLGSFGDERIIRKDFFTLCVAVFAIFALSTGCAPKTRAPESFTAMPDSTTTLVAGDQLVLTRGNATFKFRYCPPGSFEMGSPASEPGHEEYEERIPIRFTKGFWLMETELTEQQWTSIFSLPEDMNIGGSPTTPQVNIRPTELEEFLVAMNESGLAPDGWIFDVPNAAQWEYACRAGVKEPYSGGSVDEVAWYSGNSDGYVHDVAQKNPNAWGFYDMHGNLWEYSYIPVTKAMKATRSIEFVPNDEQMKASGEMVGGFWLDPETLPASSRNFYTGAAVSSSPDPGTPAFMKGGSVEDSADSCRAAARTLLFFSESERYSNVGLRVMMRQKTEVDKAAAKAAEWQAKSAKAAKATKSSQSSSSHPTVVPGMPPEKGFNTDSDDQFQKAREESRARFEAIRAENERRAQEFRDRMEQKRRQREEKRNNAAGQNSALSNEDAFQNPTQGVVDENQQRREERIKESRQKWQEEQERQRAEFIKRHPEADPNLTPEERHKIMREQSRARMEAMRAKQNEN